MGQLPFEKIKREALIKRKAETDPKFGGDPNSRSVEEMINYGIINVDKNRGPTSHQVSAYVQQILGLKKAGHSGTLDPNVTGILPIALGAATRIVQTLLISGKEYICIMHLHKDIDEKKIREACASFIGKIRQLPPIKSAIKREWRFRKIYYLEILEIAGRDVMFKVGCQAGTYIRKLCTDIGGKLGMGAHMAELRRTKTASFDESTIATMMDLTDAYHFWKEDGDETEIRKIIQPIEHAVAHLPKVWALDSAVDTICHGADLKIPGVSKIESEIQPDEMVAVMTLKDELISIGTIKSKTKDILNSEKGVAVKINKVFMEPGVYPKIERKE